MDRTDWETIDARNRAAVRPSRTRAWFAIVLIAITTAVIALEILIIGRGFSFVERFGSVTLAELSLWQRNLNTISGIYLLALVPTAIAYLAWQSRVVDNIPALSGSEPWVSPRWSIALWFVPLANFVAPYKVVADAWSRLADRASERRPTVVLGWWLLWIGGGVGTRLLITLSNPETAPELNAFLTGISVALAAHVVSGLLLIWIIREMERRIRVRIARSEAVVPPTPSLAPAPPETEAAAPATGD